MLAVANEWPAHGPSIVRDPAFLVNEAPGCADAVDIALVVDIVLKVCAIPDVTRDWRGHINNHAIAHDLRKAAGAVKATHTDEEGAALLKRHAPFVHVGLTAYPCKRFHIGSTSGGANCPLVSANTRGCCGTATVLILERAPRGNNFTSTALKVNIILHESHV
jgi:hypothetical protein